MPILTNERITQLLKPYLDSLPETLVPQLSLYLDLLMKWNARTNLTAIREPEEIVRRHFGESLFASIHLPEASTLLDFGSGAGFPGLPIQLLRPELMVTLAESQNKKATFLREAVRTLGLKTIIWADRVEAMPASAQFDIVTLRAVDRMDVALAAGEPRVRPGGVLAVLAASSGDPTDIAIPNTESSVLKLRQL
ncbi:MAG: 16S rRNA (guanine(527)-N(7))-methyltransferase RsmG [Granulicella sp.]